ncbi:OmpA family protein [Sandaracinus amylolyticus]|uniref:OmpA family protein n=1 Tax=Sandaracinus amylolyticus TaxID=927083 RepID=UPI001F2F75A8|nr:OmpA family protein [Sandaracinus amylolyticus]
MPARIVLLVVIALGGCSSLLTTRDEPVSAAAPVPDRDGDGLAGDDDRCADAPEDVDGFRDEDGCPDPDDDEDAIPDADDRCRCIAEDRDGFEDDDGCPDLDNDRDEILDACDACPEHAEVYDGCADEDGCPDQAHIVVDDTRIVLFDQLRFARGSRAIAPSEHSRLAAIAAALRDNPQLVRVRITGHADFGEPRPDRLSRARATAVRDWLVEQGIAPERLEVDGAADARPLVPRSATASARDANRRVQLEVLEVDAGRAPPRSLHSGGCSTSWRSPCFDQPPAPPRDVCAEPRDDEAPGARAPRASSHPAFSSLSSSGAP